MSTKDDKRQGPPTGRLDITAVYARAGDLWLPNSNESTKITSVELTDNGLVKIHGRMTSGPDVGVCGSWSVQLDQRMEVLRG